MGDLRFGIHSLDDLVSGFRGRTKFKNPTCRAARQMGHPQIQRLKSRATRPPTLTTLSIRIVNPDPGLDVCAILRRADYGVIIDLAFTILVPLILGGEE